MKTDSGAPAAQPDFTGDEHWGRGGRYIVDPLTGKRIPAPAEDAIPPSGALTAADAVGDGVGESQDAAKSKPRKTS